MFRQCEETIFRQQIRYGKLSGFGTSCLAAGRGTYRATETILSRCERHFPRIHNTQRRNPFLLNRLKTALKWAALGNYL